jgi:endonuclease/exonuclease/phosphatase family metal-dependent hydrolase
MRWVASFVIALLAACASAPRPSEGPLRVMSYNIHAGKDAAGVDSLERVAAVITASNADIVLLQEVDRGTKRSGNVDQLAVLTRLTGFHGAFGRSLEYQGGGYGIAILSRWPITARETLPLPVEPPQERAGGSHEPRVALVVDTATPAGDLEVINTHIDASRDDHYRLQEARDLIGAIARRRVMPRLLGGDFNSTPESAVQESLRRSGLRDSFAECGEGSGLSYPADVPAKRIDYVFLTGKFRCASARVIDAQASDHRPVLVNVIR